jgi:hypothetical protein
MNDLAAGVLGQQALSQQTNNLVALDERAFLIKQEATIKVAIPGNAHIRIMLKHRVTRNVLLLEQHGVRDPIRKRPIRFVMHLCQFERQVCLKRIGRDARATVARVDDQLQRPGFSASMYVIM